MKKKASRKVWQPYSSYGWTDFLPNRFTERMQAMVTRLDTLRPELQFEAIACRGSSGMIAAGIASVAMQLPIIYVRKPDEDCHGSQVESNAIKVARYIIVDDFICSGKTIREIHKAIKSSAEDRDHVCPVLTGVVLYNQSYGDTVLVGDNRVRVYTA